MFQVISDCHLELVEDKSIMLPKLTPLAPYLVLAGDIGNPFKANYKMFLEACSSQWTQVFVVAGNHEYYSHSDHRLISEVDAKARMVCQEFPNVSFLQCDTFKIQDPADTTKQIAIVGCTFWTSVPEDFRALVQMSMNDYACIFNSRVGHKSKPVTPAEIDEIHRDHRSWLYDVVMALEQDPNISSIVVVTHHPASFEMLDPRFSGANNPINHAYATDYSRLIQIWTKVQIWFSGHTHVTQDKQVGSTRLISNCLGYPDKYGGNNGNYNWQLTVNFVTNKL